MSDSPDPRDPIGRTARLNELPQSLQEGRYELRSVLGEGGMATVWRAYDRERKQDVALKLLHEEVGMKKSYRSRFLTEARIMARIDHPNVIRVYEVGEEGGRYWFTMEVVEGGALIDVLEKRGKFPVLESLDITFQLLQGLAAAHLAGVVHRDIKPDNVLLSPDGRCRLADFGIARIRNERVDHRTRTGVSMGTVGYMAPEQRENARAVGPAADIYAVGSTLFALVTGFEPPDLFAAHLDPALLEGVPPPVRDVIRKATTYRTDQRYPHARGMASDVAAAYDAIARDDGSDEIGRMWLERFDMLMARRVLRGAPIEEADVDVEPFTLDKVPQDMKPLLDELPPILPRGRTPTPQPSSRQMTPIPSLMAARPVSSPQMIEPESENTPWATGWLFTLVMAIVFASAGGWVVFTSLFR